MRPLSQKQIPPQDFPPFPSISTPLAIFPWAHPRKVRPRAPPSSEGQKRTTRHTPHSPSAPTATKPTNTHTRPPLPPHMPQSTSHGQNFDQSWEFPLVEKRFPTTGKLFPIGQAEIPVPSRKNSRPVEKRFSCRRELSLSMDFPPCPRGSTPIPANPTSVPNRPHSRAHENSFPYPTEFTLVPLRVRLLLWKQVSDGNYREFHASSIPRNRPESTLHLRQHAFSPLRSSDETRIGFRRD